MDELKRITKVLINLGIKKIRITGGEPLLSKDTWKVLDYIIKEKNPNIKIGFNNMFKKKDNIKAFL